MIATAQRNRSSPYLGKPGESEANARLIAAAPELLEALTLALPSVEESEQFNRPGALRLSERIRALLAKAEGGK
jgi:hypothetical protein